jgi:hypothetical protein
MHPSAHRPFEHWIRRRFSVLCRSALFAPLSIGISAPALVPFSVAPNFAAVHTRETRQFKATFAGATSANIVWQVNGVTGGNSTVGSVTPEGLYTAPAAVPLGAAVTVTAIAPGAEPLQIPVAIVAGVAFYVSGTGEDTNPGTLAEPWRTVQHAANVAIAGDVVYVRGGTYHESVNLPHSGSAEAGAIVFQSYPGELAILGGAGVPCCGDSIHGLVNITGDESYLIIEGFELQNYTSDNINNEPAGIYVSGSGTYLRILNNTVHGITESAGPKGNAHGIGFYGTSTTPLSNITISGNNVYGMVTGNSETITLDGNITGFTITGNDVHDNNNIGIDATGFYGTGPSGHDQARNGVISGNTVYNITSIENPAYNGYGADGIYCDGCTLVQIERNLVYNCDLNIEAASENQGRDTSYVTIDNNVVYGGNLAGISFGGYAASVGGSDHIVVVNNTLYNNNRTGGGGDLQIQYHASANLLENNIVYPGGAGVVINGIVDSTSSPVTADYNIYYTKAPPQWIYQGKTYSAFAAYQAASGQEKHSRFERPYLIDISGPYNLDLEAISPAWGAGNFALGAADYGAFDFAGDPRTTGAAINIGAYQK